MPRRTEPTVRRAVFVSDPLPTIELIEWTDIASFDRWHTGDPVSPMSCASVSFVLAETNEHITIAQTLDLDDGAVAAQLAIPKSCIRRRRRLKV